jgi:anthranilate phosphoribosyltransferase
LDELSPTGPNRVTQLQDGQVRTYILDPLELGLPRATLSDLKGGAAKDNATIVRSVLSGERGPRRDAVLLNAAAALAAGGAATNLAEGLSLAAQSIDSGAARAKLEAMVTFSNNGSH